MRACKREGERRCGAERKRGGGREARRDYVWAREGFLPPSFFSLVRFARPQLQPQPQMPDVFKLDTPIFAWMRTRARVYLDVNTS